MNWYRNPNLQAAFDLYVREQDALLPTEEELSSVTLSPAFHARMERLLSRRKRGYYRLFGTVGRRVASFLIALLIAATTVTFSVKALREKVMAFFAEAFEKYTQVTFADDVWDASREGFEPRKPTYLPEGYALVEEGCCTDTSHFALYAGGDGQYVEIYQTSNRGHTTVDTEGVPYEEVCVRGEVGMVIRNKEHTTLVFAHDGRQCYLSGTGSLEELIRIAESML